MSTNLGQCISNHRGTFGAGGMLWYLGGVLVLSGLVGLARVTNPPPGQTAAEVGITALAALLVGVLCLLMPVSRLRQSVEVFEHGFAWTHLLGARTVARADIGKVEILTRRTKMGSVTKVIVGLRSGQTVTLAGLDNPEQLASFLRSPVAPAQGWAPAGAAPVMQPWAPPGAPASPGGWRPPGT